EASKIFRRVMDLYGVRSVYSQTQYAEAAAVREVLGDRIRFVAIPEYMAEDRGRAHREGFLENIQKFHDEFGARMVKFWRAPRIRDYMQGAENADLVGLDSEWVVRAAELATSLGMMLMTHVADPDTWFETKYADSSRYGTKEAQYLPLERMLDRFTQPWLLAHMAGWPEDLDFLDGLLERHPNAHMDTSATKWQVRELSKHPTSRVREFFDRWRGRIFFGTDVVTSDEHLRPSESERFGSTLASNEAEAFELYAGRFWALRTMFETDYRGASPIADPDLMLVEPERFDAMSAPALTGHGLSGETLADLYAGGATSVMDAWYDAH
ncbi:MAG: hypothetical protein AAGK04_04120, partial [Planctomycetota bacterium]